MWGVVIGVVVAVTVAITCRHRKLYSVMVEYYSVSIRARVSGWYERYEEQHPYCFWPRRSV